MEVATLGFNEQLDKAKTEIDKAQAQIGKLIQGCGKLALGPYLTEGNATTLPPWQDLKRAKAHKRWAECPEADDIENVELPRPPEVTAEVDSLRVTS